MDCPGIVAQYPTEIGFNADFFNTPLPPPFTAVAFSLGGFGLSAMDERREWYRSIPNCRPVSLPLPASKQATTAALSEATRRGIVKVGRADGAVPDMIPVSTNARTLEPAYEVLMRTSLPCRAKWK